MLLKFCGENRNHAKSSFSYWILNKIYCLIVPWSVRLTTNTKLRQEACWDHVKFDFLLIRELIDTSVMIKSLFKCYSHWKCVAILLSRLFWGWQQILKLRQEACCDHVKFDFRLIRELIDTSVIIKSSFKCYSHWKCVVILFSRLFSTPASGWSN